MSRPASPDWTDPAVPLGAGIDFADPNSPLARFYLTAAQVTAVGLVGLVGLLVALLPLAPSDIWGHLALGRWMVEHRALPDREPLNPYTDQTVPVFHPDWAAKVGYHLLYRAGETLAGGDPARRLAGGVDALRAAHAVVVGVTLALLVLAYRRAGGRLPLAVAAVGVVFVLAFASLGVQRPQAFGLICFAGLLAAVTGDAPVRRAWLAVPLVFAAWANLHGSWTAGLLLLGLHAVGRAMDVRTVRDPELGRRLLRLGLAMAAVCVNPYGPWLYRNVIAFSGHPNLAAVGEWQPLDIDGQVGAGVVYLLVLGSVLAAFAVSPRAVSAGELLIVLAFAVWPLVQQRGMVWWLLVWPTVILPHLGAVAEARGRRPGQGVPTFRKTLLAGLLLAVFALVSPAGQWARTGKPATTGTAPGTPLNAAAALWGTADPGDDLGGLRGRLPAGAVFADEVTGEYLQWAAPPGTGPTLFTHAHLFPPRHWDECRAAIDGGGGWPELLDRLRVTVVVIDPNRPLANQLRDHPGWTVLADGPRPPLVAVRNPGGAP